MGRDCIFKQCNITGLLESFGCTLRFCCGPIFKRKSILAGLLENLGLLTSLHTSDATGIFLAEFMELNRYILVHTLGVFRKFMENEYWEKLFMEFKICFCNTMNF